MKEVFTFAHTALIPPAHPNCKRAVFSPWPGSAYALNIRKRCEIYQVFDFAKFVLSQERPDCGDVFSSVLQVVIGEFPHIDESKFKAS